jgi:phosphinothricin acetyltransferase
VIIREVRLSDIDSVVEIYEQGVKAGIANCDLADHSLSTHAAQQEWLESRRGPYQAFVAEVDGAVAGWSCLSPYDRRPCFASTAYTSTYVDSRLQGRGIGRALRVHLIDHAERVGMQTLISRIFAKNPASIHLTESLGFRKVGTLHRVVCRDGDFWDALLYERVLATEPTGGAAVVDLCQVPG